MYIYYIELPIIHFIGCVCSIPGPDLRQKVDVKHAGEAIGSRAHEQSDQQRGVEQWAEVGR